MSDNDNVLARFLITAGGYWSAREMVPDKDMPITVNRSKVIAGIDLFTPFISFSCHLFSFIIIVIMAYSQA